MALEVPLDARDLVLAHGILARQELRDRGVGLELDAQAVELALAEAGEEDAPSRAASCSGSVPVWTAAPPGSAARSMHATRLPK